MTKVSSSALTPNELSQVSEGIFYTNRPFVLVDPTTIAFLKDKASTNMIGRARVCAHPSPEDDQHDMLIVSHCNTYVAPHRHLSKSETFLVLEGRADVLLFDEHGNLTASIPMGPSGSGLPFFYRMPAGQFHSLRIETEVVVFVESTKGPFRKRDMENAPWAPKAQDNAAGRSYIAALRATKN